jgi:hypothetical protein
MPSNTDIFIVSNNKSVCNWIVKNDFIDSEYISEYLKNNKIPDWKNKLVIKWIEIDKLHYSTPDYDEEDFPEHKTNWLYGINQPDE